MFVLLFRSSTRPRCHPNIYESSFKIMSLYANYKIVQKKYKIVFKKKYKIPNANAKYKIATIPEPVFVSWPTVNAAKNNRPTHVPPAALKYF